LAHILVYVCFDAPENNLKTRLNKLLQYGTFIRTVRDLSCPLTFFHRHVGAIDLTARITNFLCHFEINRSKIKITPDKKFVSTPY